MRITSTDTYLSLIANTLDSKLIPELASNEAKAMAGIIKNVLGELQRRERDGGSMLTQHIAQGRTIADAMAKLLAELGGETGENATAGDGQPLSPVEIHAALTERIATLERALIARRQAAADPQRISALLRRAAEWENDYYVGLTKAATPPQKVGGAEKTAGPLTRDLLEAFLRQQHPDRDRCSVTAFEQIPGGFSKQTYRVVVRDAAGAEQNLIVRKSSPTPMVLHGGFLVDREFHLLKDLHATGLPVAKPLYLGKDVPGVDGDFYVMTALSGKAPGTFLGGADGEIPESVLLHMAELLARLHSVKMEAFSEYFAKFPNDDARNDTVESCYRRQVAEWKAYHARVEHLPSPLITYLLDWLEQHVPASSAKPVLVHGDFSVHNVLAESGRITGILDLECTMFGAPEQDLSWIRPHVSKCIDWDRFVAHYVASGGREPKQALMDYCLAFSCMRITVGPNKGHLNLLQGLDQDIRYTMIELGFSRELMTMALASSGG